MGVDKTAVGIATGVKYTCALLNDGEVKCWGAGDVGQLGNEQTAQLGDDTGEMELLTDEGIKMPNGVLDYSQFTYGPK